MTHFKLWHRQAALGMLCATILAVLPGTWAAENPFSGNGPFGGRATTVQFDPSDATRAYALGFGNGLFFSDDGGTTWQRFEVDHPSISNRRCREQTVPVITL